MAEPTPIVIKKITKRKHAGHHGGSWKVAYADFVTAMMAFFLLMWLLNSTSEEQKQQLSEYFEDPILFVENKKAGGGPSIIDFGGLIRTSANSNQEQLVDDIPKKDDDESSEANEVEKLISLKYDIDKAISDSLVLSDFQEQLKLDITPEGLRIQIIDKENKSMFNIGSAYLTDYAYLILEELSELLIKVPNRISISGHTDATPYADSYSNYSNWELSTDRANSARRAFLEAGMPEEKIGRVVGLASSVPLDAEDPFSHINRRISVMVLNKKTSQSIGLEPAEEAQTKNKKVEEDMIDEETPEPLPTDVFLPF